jgi:hypothetical protein
MHTHTYILSSSFSPNRIHTPLTESHTHITHPITASRTRIQPARRRRGVHSVRVVVYERRRPPINPRAHAVGAHHVENGQHLRRFRKRYFSVSLLSVVHSTRFKNLRNLPIPIQHLQRYTDLDAIVNISLKQACRQLAGTPTTASQARRAVQWSCVETLFTYRKHCVQAS